MSECVIAAGCEASVSVPPRLTASLITLGCHLDDVAEIQ
jgi:hypothetical protein